MKYSDDISRITKRISVVAREMIPDCGEDAYSWYLEEDGCSFAVFDGCGGSGACTYPQFGGKTGAYVASRQCEKVYFKWYKEFLREGYIIDVELISMILEQLQLEFFEELQRCQRFIDGGEALTAPVLKGTLIKAFPTTMAAVMCDYYDDQLSLSFLWAGNSRGYILNENGLVQITVDDIMGNGDALENLRSDAPLSNLIYADTSFVLHGSFYEVDMPIVVIVATDGCFDSLASPMHFEYLILTTLLEAKSFSEWKNSIYDILKECAADDFSFIAGFFGKTPFRGFQELLARRQQYMKEHYILPLTEDYDRQIDGLWQEYKTSYYRRKF